MARLRQLYEHQSLRPAEIRILVLSLGKLGTPLFGHLETTSLENGKAATRDSSYEAISYAWESPILSRSISTPNGRILIPRSLHEALQHLRYPHKPRRLWADAICISQTDNEEKAAQVAMMADIFGSASKVLVWLGPAQPLDALAFATLSYEYDLANTSYSDDHRPFLDYVLREEPWCLCCKERFQIGRNLGMSGLAAAKSLLQRQWFTRVWTMQEVAGRPERVVIHSGSHHASMLALRNAYHRWFEAHSLTYNAHSKDRGGFTVVAQLHLVFEVYLNSLRRGTDIEDHISALIQTAQRQCSDARDRLFALRGILRIRDESLLLPDYKLPTSEVYRRLVVCYFQIASVKERQESQDPAYHPSIIFGLCGRQSQKFDHQSDWPSWVPNFHNLPDAAARRADIYDQGFYHDTSLRPEFWPFSRSSVRFKALCSSDQPSQIRIRGRVFGTIACAGERSSFAWGVRDVGTQHVKLNSTWLKRLIRSHQVIGNFAQSQLGLGDIASAEYDALVRSIISAGMQPTDFPKDRARCLSLFTELLSNESLGQGDLDAKRLFNRIEVLISDGYHRFGDPSRLICSATTAVDMPPLIGWVPSTAISGDRVCIFSGCPFPYVLRAIEDDKYRLIGEAWFHGLHEWDALGMSRQEWTKYEDVDVRYKGQSRWWRGKEPDGGDNYVPTESEFALEEWEGKNLSEIVLV